MLGFSDFTELYVHISRGYRSAHETYESRKFFLRLWRPNPAIKSGIRMKYLHHRDDFFENPSEKLSKISKPKHFWCIYKNVSNIDIKKKHAYITPRIGRRSAPWACERRKFSATQQCTHVRQARASDLASGGPSAN